jgi:hypothetical protein
MFRVCRSAHPRLNVQVWSSPSSAPGSVRHASSRTSYSSSYFNRRQQVAGDGYTCRARNCCAAPFLQYPQNAFQSDPVRAPRSASTILALLRLMQEGPINSTTPCSTTRIASCSCNKFIKPYEPISLSVYANSFHRESEEFDRACF